MKSKSADPVVQFCSRHNCNAGTVGECYEKALKRINEGPATRGRDKRLRDVKESGLQGGSDHCPASAVTRAARSTAKTTAKPTAQSTANTTAKPTAQSTAKTTANPTAQTTTKPTAQTTAKTAAKPTGKVSNDTALAAIRWNAGADVARAALNKAFLKHLKENKFNRTTNCDDTHTVGYRHRHQRYTVYALGPSSTLRGMLVLHRVGSGKSFIMSDLHSTHADHRRIYIYVNGKKDDALRDLYTSIHQQKPPKDLDGFQRELSGHPTAPISLYSMYEFCVILKRGKIKAKDLAGTLVTVDEAHNMVEHKDLLKGKLIITTEGQMSMIRDILRLSGCKLVLFTATPDPGGKLVEMVQNRTSKSTMPRDRTPRFPFISLYHRRRQPLYSKIDPADGWPRVIKEESTPTMAKKRNKVTGSWVDVIPFYPTQGRVEKHTGLKLDPKSVSPIVHRTVSMTIQELYSDPTPHKEAKVVIIADLNGGHYAITELLRSMSVPFVSLYNTGPSGTSIFVPPAKVVISGNINLALVHMKTTDVKIIVINPMFFAEGINVFNATLVINTTPGISSTKLEQSIGRGDRGCGMQALPADQRKVTMVNVINASSEEHAGLIRAEFHSKTEKIEAIYAPFAIEGL